jgi:hypothetical protein
LRRAGVFRYKKAGPRRLNAEFTLIRDPLDRNEGLAMSTRRDFRAMTRGAFLARPGAALILGGLLLLSAP